MAWKLRITDISGWVEKNNVSWSSALHSKIEYNCGAITRWETGSDTGGDWVHFDTPECAIDEIENSIGAAGGPHHIDCHGHG